MKWFLKTCVWASVGCLGATASASAQTAWRPPTTETAEVRPAPIGIALGKPTPIAPETLRVANAFVPISPAAPTQQATYSPSPRLAPEPLRVVNAFVPISPAAPLQQATYSPAPRVVRGAMPAQADEPNSLFLPTDVLPLAQPRVATPFQPVQGVQPPPKDK